MMQKDLLFWIWLSEALGAMSRDFKMLAALYENPYDLFHAEEDEIERIDGVSARTRAALCNKSLARATEIMDACERLSVGILTYADPAYPSALKDLREPPVLLYYVGEIPDFAHRLSVGVVGTRRMSAYGMQSAYKIGYELASVGAIVVSGMAAGIDGVCAAAAMAAKGTTVAILGCGIDVIYPKHHKVLMDRIRKSGLILSEYPPGTRPNHYHFPIRNRLISGLSQGTVVVEAGIGSGSLITAKDAILQGKEVFAVPANVGSSGAEGTNGLLRDGAHMVLGVSDILKPYEYVYANTLHTEVLHKRDGEIHADLHYLEELGVIELTRRPADKEPPMRAADAPTPEEKKATKAKAPRSAAAEAKAPVDRMREEKREASAPPEEMLSSLTSVQRAVFEAIPDDRAVTADALGGIGYPYGEIIAALTMLEILGLIQKLPGALYTKS